MARRSRDWNMDLAEDLRDAEFVGEFLLAAIDEGVSVRPAGKRPSRPCPRGAWRPTMFRRSRWPL